MNERSWPVVSADEADAILTRPGAPFAMSDTPIQDRLVRTYDEAPTSLAELFRKAPEWGAREAIIYGNERISFEALHRAASHLAAAFDERFGLGKGDRVAIAMRNLPEWVACFWAITATGKVLVPLNAWWQAEELRYAIEDSGASLVIADQQRADLLGPILDELAIPILVARLAPEDERSLTSIIGPTSEWHDLPQKGLGDVAILPEDRATLFYTSGTTGKPKGAIGTHRNMTTNLLNLRVRFARSALRRGDPVPPQAPPQQKTTLLPTPLFHVTGTHSGIVPAMLAGTRIIFMHKWELETALSLVERERANTIVTVPTMSWQIVKCDHLDRYDLSSLETITFGGAPGGSGLVDQLKARFPRLQFANGYGLTETSSVLASNCAEDLLARPESVGRIMPCNDARIVDDDGRDVAHGERGELLVRGPNIIEGYWGRPRATDSGFDGEWFRTGDIGRFDDEGFLFILDRKKDVIIRGGENIYCAEIEDILHELSDVAEAALIGVPHPELGEEAAAIIVARNGQSVDISRMRDVLCNKLASFKIPAHFILRDTALPRNDAGKVMKPALRTEIADAWSRRGA